MKWVADRSIEFLRDHMRYRPDQPFFLWSSYINPHPPFAACEPYASMYDPEDIELPLNVERSLEELAYGALGHRGRLDGAHRDPDRMRRIKALYFGLVTHVDACIGRTLDELERLGLTEDTIVILASDHGDMLGDQGLSQKNVPFEPSIRIPLLIRWPGISVPGQRSEGFASLLDVFPTLIDGLNLEAPTTADSLVGNSLLGSLSGAGPLADEFVIDYGYGDDRWLCMLTREFKYTYWYAEGYEELYDLRSDPDERRNLLRGTATREQRFRYRGRDEEPSSRMGEDLRVSGTCSTTGRFPSSPCRRVRPASRSCARLSSTRGDGRTICRRTSIDMSIRSRLLSLASG